MPRLPINTIFGRMFELDFSLWWLVLILTGFVLIRIGFDADSHKWD